jgi:hypothetical protein
MAGALTILLAISTTSSRPVPKTNGVLQHDGVDGRDSGRAAEGAGNVQRSCHRCCSDNCRADNAADGTDGDACQETLHRAQVVGEAVAGYAARAEAQESRSTTSMTRMLPVPLRLLSLPPAYCPGSDP